MFVSFLSDFGLEDEFVGVVHGVIARLAPAVRIIDVTHGIAPGNVKAGALALVRAIQYLPEGVALAVVDPGVGGARLPVAVATPWGTFVGPDNGLLAPAVAITGGALGAARIESERVVIPGAGATFDGRDRFAPAAALIASGELELEELGAAVPPDLLTPLTLPLPAVANGEVTGEIWWVDHFGNAETNIGPDDLAEAGLSMGEEADVWIGGASHRLRWVATYEEGEEGYPVLLVDSVGLVSLALRRGRAVEELGASEGVSVRITHL